MSHTKSFIQEVFQQDVQAFVTAGFCLRADAYRETWESGPTSWNRRRNSVHYILCRSGNDDRRREKERRCREALGLRVGALGRQTDRTGKLPLISFVLCHSRVKPEWIKPAVAIDRHNIRSGYFRNDGYLYNEVYLATGRTKHVSRARTSKMIVNEHGDSQNRYCQQWF